jgi:hypothetical protein
MNLHRFECNKLDAIYKYQEAEARLLECVDESNPQECFGRGEPMNCVGAFGAGIRATRLLTHKAAVDEVYSSCTRYMTLLKAFNI